MQSPKLASSVTHQEQLLLLQCNIHQGAVVGILPAGILGLGQGLCTCQHHLNNTHFLALLPLTSSLLREYSGKTAPYYHAHRICISGCKFLKHVHAAELSLSSPFTKPRVYPASWVPSGRLAKYIFARCLLSRQNSTMFHTGWLEVNRLNT